MRHAHSFHDPGMGIQYGAALPWLFRGRIYRVLGFYYAGLERDVVVSEGEIAYGAYRAYLMQDGDYIPRWSDLPYREKSAWQYASSEAISVHVAAALA